jgi:hypothetical protein
MTLSRKTVNKLSVVIGLLLSFTLIVLNILVDLKDKNYSYDSLEKVLSGVFAYLSITLFPILFLKALGTIFVKEKNRNDWASVVAFLPSLVMLARPLFDYKSSENWLFILVTAGCGAGLSIYVFIWILVRAVLFLFDRSRQRGNRAS